MIEIEKEFNVKGMISGEIMGTMKMRMHGESNKAKPYKLENNTIFIHYDIKKKEYVMKVIEKYKPEDNKISEEEYVALDPGIRKFQTCLRKKEAIQYGSNMS